MYSVNFSVTIIIIYLFTRVQLVDECYYADDHPATNTQYGLGMCCYFAFDWTVDMYYMKNYTPNPHFYAKAILPKHKIAFTESNDPDDPTATYATIIEDPTTDLPGVAYLLSLYEYDTFLKSQTIQDGKRYGYAVTKNVQITLNGQNTTTNCNTFLSAGMWPKKPCKTVIDILVEVFTNAGFLPTYIKTISQIPSEPSC